MITAEEKLNTAIKYHREGQLQEAEKLYNELLKENQNNDSAMHCLGILRYQTNRIDEAVNYIKKAIELNPQKANYYKDLAGILSETGRSDESIEYYLKVLKINPSDADSLFRLGLVFHQMNNFDNAVNCYQGILKLDPDNVDTLNNLGVIYHQKNLFNEASQCFQKVLELEPDHFLAYNNLGKLFKDLNMTEGAINCFLNVIQLKPDQADAYSNLGEVLKDSGNPGGSIQCYLKAIELMPDNPEAYFNLGEVYEDKYNLEEAVKCYNKVLELLPGSAHARLRLGFLHLLNKDFEKGWELYENRINIRKPEFRPQFTQPEWNGGSLEGKTIYVYPEMGLGDIIMFSRYFPVLNSLGAKVLFKPYAELQELFRNADLKAEIIPTTTPDSELKFDTYIHLLSIPKILKTNTENIPYKSGYIKADPEKVKLYREKYFNNNDFKIGIVWHCKNIFSKDKFRSINDLSYFHRFAELPNVKVYSLQKGEGESQLGNLPDGTEIVNLGSTFNDFSDTAAAIENLDLVITIDTSVPHLSGAMGKPTWILLPYIRDWKWFLEPESTPWYDTVRLFRQEEPSNWQNVIDKAYSELLKTIN